MHTSGLATALGGAFLSCLLLGSAPLTPSLQTAHLPLDDEQALEDAPTYVSFQEKLAFYLDSQTRGFIEQMIVKERFLLDLIRNVQEEIGRRGIGGLDANQYAFTELFETRDQMIADYTREIERLSSILEDVYQLEKLAEDVAGYQEWEELNQMKGHLKALLGSRNLARKDKPSAVGLRHLMVEYSVELDSLISMFDQLSAFERKAIARGDEEILKTIRKQKGRLISVMAQLPTGATTVDDLVVDYVEESEGLLKVFQDVEELENQVDPADSTVLSDIQATREQILGALDKRVVELVEKPEKEAKAVGRGPRRSVSEIFKIWKAERYTDYKVQLLQYKVIKNRLLETATAVERDRMFRRDLEAAIVQYADGNYAVAGKEFESIIDYYGEDINGFDVVTFYVSEANYSQDLYELAWSGYLRIVNDFPTSQHFGESLLRLMNISYTYGWKNKFLEFYQVFIPRETELPHQVKNMINYLAGFFFYEGGRYKDAETCLLKVTPDSRHYPSAFYLLGVVYSNLGRYSDAERVFQKLADKTNYPWTDVNTAIIRNDALLKLGFIAYRRGDLPGAIAYFDEVSKGHPNVDQGIIGVAWANLKLGDFEESITSVNQLFQGFLSSQYAYEALVLSAHCKRVLEQNEAAKRDLRYVSTAKAVLDLSKQYNEERTRILAQAKELDRLEKAILEQQDETHYQEIVALREKLDHMLTDFRYRGFMGSHLLEEYTDERKELIRQIEQFGEVERMAEERGQRDIASNARRMQRRLIGVLQTYQADQNVENVNYFIDFPLATKESSRLYEKDIVDRAERDMRVEKARLERDLANVQELLERSEGGEASTSQQIDLELLLEDLKGIQSRLDRFHVWLANNEVETIDTDFNQWADFSGFGLSDIVFNQVREKDRLIGIYHKNIDTIERIMRDRRLELQMRIAELEQREKELNERIQDKELKQRINEMDRYFEEFYFDTKESEVEEEGSKEEETVDEVSHLLVPDY